MTHRHSGLHVEAEGNGPPLVLLHGWGLNLRVWDGIVPDLARDFRVIRVDLPGHGRSVWRADHADLDHLAQAVLTSLVSPLTSTPQCDLPPFSLLGWSLGGHLALQLAALTPAIDKLVLVGTTPRFVTATDWPHGMASHVLRRFADQLATDYRQTVHDFLELQVRGSADASEVLRMMQSALFTHGEASPEALKAGLHVLAESDLRSRLNDVRQPTLVMAGQYDRVTLPAASKALAAKLCEGRYVELRRAGHAPFLSHPESFNEAVRAFLKQPVATDFHATA